ncbi:MAG: non-canonical purine NTP pyrophosphatase [bacterium]|nr:non-canonical purine NTP pyrophosphatase [bacterium]
MKKLLIATKNPAKLEEFRMFLKDLPLKIVGLADLNISDSFEETGKTFTENAKAKAMFFVKKSGLLTLADDGGIEIEALGGEPGIKSRRWLDGKTDAQDEELINYTLKRLEGVPLSKRRAQFRAVLALAIPSGEVYVSEGVIKGIIAEKPLIKRKVGYPYRSLFYLPQIKKYYFEDELTEEETQKFNHRAKALKRLEKVIKSKLC